MTRRSTASFILLAALGPSSARGQTASAARRDSVYQRMLDLPSLARGGVVQVRWMADSNRFWYVDSAPDRTRAILVDPAKGTRSDLLDVARTRAALARALGHEPPYTGLPFSTLTLVDREAAVRFSLEGRDWILDRTSYELKAATPPSSVERDRTEPRLVRRGWPATSPDLMEVASPDRRWFLGERGGNLWLRSTMDGREQQLTTDGAPDYEWTVGDAKWSPDGLHIAALKADTRAMAKVPVMHWLKPVEEVEWRPFAKVGGAISKLELHLVDALSRRDVKADLGDATDHYLDIIGFTPDSRELLVYRMSRDMKRLDVMAVATGTGAVRTVLTETQPTFIKNISGNPGWGELLTLLDDGKRFIWTSERDGWDHLYLYNIDGTLIRRLTSGSFPVLKVVGVDRAGGWVYFTAHAEPRLYDTHVYRVNLDGTGFKRLTEGPGTHTATLSPSKAYFVDIHSNIDRPPTTELRSSDGRAILTLARATTDSLKAIGWRPPEEFTAKAADGKTDLYGVLIKPFDFDSTRKYPVIEYIYGGPQTSNVPHAFGQAWVREQAMAQLGFVVFIVDGRGTIERGKAFQDVVYGNFGRNEIPDHAAALKNVAVTRPYLDLSRVGIFGGSWGGYMTVRALLLAPETYHVGVATYPVGDLYDHAASAIEPYMGLIENNRAGYEYGSSLRLVNNLRGKLMLVVGTSDVNATFSATMKLVDAFTRAGKPYELKVFNEQNHSLTGVQDYWQETVRRFFVENLKP
jgi:dipeptidyl aminopeptidase/acylaminoacyl peptidase